MFWAIAAAALFIAAIVTFFPLLRRKSLWQPAALALTFLLPAAGLWIYSDVGTPEAIGMAPTPRQAESTAGHSPESAEMDSMIAGLRAKLAENPADLDGWMLLARTLRATQRFPEAVTALETAHGIDPENPYVMVELAETWIFTNPDGRIEDRVVAMLERALEIDPSQQKALWLMGIAASQAGDDAFAISYWESLLELMEPGSKVAQSVQVQIDEAKTRLGMGVEVATAAPVTETSSEPVAQPDIAVAPAPAEDGTWQGTPISINISEEAGAAIPEQFVLFVMIRSPGPAVGPPIGVRRLINPAFPLALTITDRDSMLQERKISLESEIQIQARVSLSGSPTANNGDWQTVPVTVALASTETVELILDQRVE